MLYKLLVNHQISATDIHVVLSGVGMIWCCLARDSTRHSIGGGAYMAAVLVAMHVFISVTLSHKYTCCLAWTGGGRRI